jgi:hypothetical protein
MEPLRQDDKPELFKRCFNRCYQAFNEIYGHEKTKLGSLWRFDERYYEQGIEILYERYCYAMAIIADKFNQECSLLHGLAYAQKKSLPFATFLSGCTDEVFKRGTRDMGWSDTTMEYYMQDYLDEAYDNYWDEHEKLQSKIVAVRSSFYPEERTYLHGFSHYDEDNEDRDNLDSLHMMRICKRWSDDVDVSKFLGDTKRLYIPTIIKAFMATPKTDMFATKPPPKWQAWRS